MKKRTKFAIAAFAAVVFSMFFGTQVANAYNFCNGGSGNLGPGDNTWVGTSADNWCEGGDGDDNLAGKGGDDYLAGDAGSDYLQGDDGNDQLHGGGGTNNRVYGNKGNDALYSVNGNTTDRLVGGDGYNICHGDWNDANDTHDYTESCDEKHWTHYYKT